MLVFPSPLVVAVEPSLRAFAQDPMILSAVPATAAQPLKEVELVSKPLHAQELLFRVTAAVLMIFSAV